jgi:hypothetical protein
MELANSKTSCTPLYSPTSEDTLHHRSLVEAQEICLEIATNMLRLPCERRDMIYEQLFNEYPPPFYNMVWPHGENQWRLHYSGSPCNCVRLHPHYIDLNFIDRQVAHEVLEIFKSIAAAYHYEFNMYHHEVEDFVTGDEYHVGITREELFRGTDLQINF